MSELIVVEAVSKRYVTSSGPVDALRDVSLSVGAGEFCTVIGPSGCGKSTLLGMLGGLVAADAGRVAVDGRPVDGPDPRRVATVFQDPGLFPWRTTVENVEFGLELQGVAAARRRQVAADLLGPLGLRDFAAKYPRELSGGMRQRVAIGRALAIDTPIILMDEPFGALDEQTRVLMGEWLLDIWRRTRKTVVFVTHSLHEALALSTRVVVMTARPGRIKSVLELPMPYPRAMESVELVALRAKLWADIRDESLRAMGETPRVTVLAIRAAIVVALLGAWEIVGRTANPLLYVPPSAAVPALGRLLVLDSYPDLAQHLLLTLREILVAYALAIAAGLGCGFALGFNRLVGRAYGPILAALYAVPAVVWYPSLMLFFGLDAASKIAFGFLLGFFPITLAVLAGIRQVSPQMLAVARAFGADGFTAFRKVTLPAMLFTLVAGLRTGLALTVIGVIVGEILGSKSGMGSLINHAYGLFRTADYIALVVVTLVLIVATDALASTIEHRAQRWTE